MPLQSLCVLQVHSRKQLISLSSPIRRRGSWALKRSRSRESGSMQMSSGKVLTAACGDYVVWHFSGSVHPSSVGGRDRSFNASIRDEPEDCHDDVNRAGEPGADE